MATTFKATSEHVGKEFYPADNSYSQDLSNGERPTINNGAALAGDWQTAGIKVRIVQAPFKMKIHNVVGDDVVKDFCIVQAEGKLFLVLNIFSTVQPVPEDVEW